MAVVGAVVGAVAGAVAGAVDGALDGAGAGAVPFVAAGGKMADAGVVISALFRTRRGLRRLFQTQQLAPRLAGLFVADAFLQ